MDTQIPKGDGKLSQQSIRTPVPAVHSLQGKRGDILGAMSSPAGSIGDNGGQGGLEEMGLGATTGESRA